MKYKEIKINTATPESPVSKIMIIYTGGTFGMSHDKNGVLIPFDFSLILEHLPTLRNLMLDLSIISFENPIDSSNVEPAHWQIIGTIIYDNYTTNDGFVVLHGTDTMAYTASALSFMLQGLAKPVVFTGAQLPISETRSDARENLITSLEIASAKINGKAIVPEVCIYFDDQLIRANRAKKVESMHFDAFQSENYPLLAKAGVSITYSQAFIKSADHNTPMCLFSQLNQDIIILKLFPGITEATVEAILSFKGLKAVIMETFGAGNAPSSGWFLKRIKNALERGIIILNISQCPGGMVVQGKYETSKTLQEIGVISGKDMTCEAAITKLMVLLGNYPVDKVKALILQPIAGEITVND
jgi:L-asparaginase